MIRSLWNGAAGMRAQSLKLDNIANNIANVNTPGFKKSRVTFADLVYQPLREKGLPVKRENPTYLSPQIGVGSRVEGISRVFWQGNLMETGRELDLAISGKGFFRVELPSGEKAYTRVGSLEIDAEGYLVTAGGNRLSPAIRMPEGTTGVTITREGEVLVTGAGGENRNIGRIKLYRFTNPAALKPLGKNLFTPTDAAGEVQEGNPGEDGFGTVQQGVLEGSNVQLAEEITEMIIAQRAYEINARVVRTSDEMWALANNIRR
ncbi:flagellar basal-body rod protein FlgG [Calderihabitans maritimus]|uniref:Flagellar basal-body rod protein FlgG n=1 Tax=Calderihabitans maritimus TaxID=1246530 RepID=A0A1Z5HTU0_9FIRM|nr:flagellar basal-body rod protein FlgG [Calderihabitans maritimus]GAW92944.1 flagellar basal body rod protein FlgG [Calderihabitans maritimus]